MMTLKSDYKQGGEERLKGEEKALIFCYAYCNVGEFWIKGAKGLYLKDQKVTEGATFDEV